MQVFVESERAPADGAPIMQADVPSSLPHEAADFCGRCSVKKVEFFSIRPTAAPAAPIYPVWTWDIHRSTQVVDGQYDEIVPQSFEFIPTLNCIYRCHQCAYREPKQELGIWASNDFSPAFHMTEAEMRTILGKLRAAGVEETLFTGGGEPLLNDATPAAMQFAKALGFRVGLYTNGALIDDRKAKAILQAGPAYVRISLNAGDRRLHREHHNPLDSRAAADYFRNTVRALYLLAKEKTRARGPTVVAVSYLVGPDNADDVANGARLVASVARAFPGAIGYVRFTPSVNYFGNRQHARGIFERALQRIEDEAAPLLADAGVEPRVYFHRFRGLYEPRPYNRCLAAGWYGGVGPGGVLYWCCEKLFQRPFAFGSLLDGSFAERWAGDERKWVAARVADAVRGVTTSPCPVLCKPHEHNKVFAKIETLRELGRIDHVRAWLREIHRIVATAQADARPRLDGFTSDPQAR